MTRPSLHEAATACLRRTGERNRRRPQRKTQGGRWRRCRSTRPRRLRALVAGARLHHAAARRAAAGHPAPAARRAPGSTSCWTPCCVRQCRDRRVQAERKKETPAASGVEFAWQEHHALPGNVQIRASGGEEIQTFDVCAEIDCEGACASGRASVPQPRGQHAHGIESYKKESCKEAPGKKDRRQACREKNRQEDRKESFQKESSQKSRGHAPGQGTRERSEGRPDRRRSLGICPQGWLAPQAGRHKSAVRDDAAGHAPQRQLGGTILRPQETSAAGRWPGKADAARAVRPCLGRACSRTVAAARRIAAKGERLLERYRRIKQKT